MFFFLVDVTDNNEENWEKYLGDKDDAHSSIMIRFPDGNRVTKDIPCSSQFQVRILGFLLLYQLIKLIFSGYCWLRGVRRILVRQV